jgi:hypothetical protein
MFAVGSHDAVPDGGYACTLYPYAKEQLWKVINSFQNPDMGTAESELAVSIKSTVMQSSLYIDSLPTHHVPNTLNRAGSIDGNLTSEPHHAFVTDMVQAMS